MQTDTFMATAAQVIPTIGIAIGLEVGSSLRDALAKSPAKGFQHRRSLAGALILGMGFNLATGELSALSALLFHYPGWTVWIPVGVTSFTIIYALGGMVTIPFFKVQDTARTPRPRRERPRRR